jgi:hypothetical protein
MNILTTSQLNAHIAYNIEEEGEDTSPEDMLDHIFGEYTAMSPDSIRILDEKEVMYVLLTNHVAYKHLKGAAIVEATHSWDKDELNYNEEEYAGQKTYWIYTKEYGFEEPIDQIDRTDYKTAKVVAARLEGIERGDDYNDVARDCYGADEEIEYITLTFNNGDTAQLNAKVLMTALGYNMSDYNAFGRTEDDKTPRILYSKERQYGPMMYLHGGSKFG